jgi:hypothetical protein
LDTLFAPVIPENLLLYQGETGLMNYSKFHSRDYILPEESENPSSPENTPSPDSPDNRTRIKKKNLINKLNYVHFNDETILVKLKHKKYDSELTLEAKPQPCIKDVLECRWVPIQGLDQKLRSYEVQCVMISDGLKLISLEPKVLKFDSQSIVMELPDFCFELSDRKVRRHLGSSIQIEFIQNGAVFYGKLVDFSSQSFKVQISIEPPQTFQWVQPDSPAHVNFKDINRILFSGEVTILRYTQEQQKRYYILKPVIKRLNRFKEKEFRSLRYILNPSPSIVFSHPLTKKITTLPVFDISGSGFSVEENEENSVLFPGLILPDIEIEIANNCSIKCLSQVVYTDRTNRVREKGIKSGLAILDMDVQDQMKLAGILQRSNNKNTYVCNRVNLDSLWKFFFDAGFIYPEKYTEFHDNKQKFMRNI